MTNYPKLSAENNSARQEAMPADEWLRQLDALVDSYDEERKTGTAAGRVKARAAIKAHARCRIEPAAQQDVSAAAPAMNKDLMKLMPEVLASLRATGDNVSLVADVERALVAAQQDASAAQAVPDGWSGWACQYPGKMPRLYGSRHIAELNCDAENGDRLIFLSTQPSEQAQQPASAPVDAQECGCCGRPDGCDPDCDAPKGEPSDEDIEATVHELGMRWDGDHWICEDADLHPVVRGLLARYTAPADTSGPNGWDSTRLDAAAIRNAALDEAAQLCEGLVRTGMLPAAIRALKTDQQEKGDE